MRAGIWITRGIDLGAWTTASLGVLPKSSLPSKVTKKFKLLLITLGKGWAGSNTIGVSKGTKSF